MVFRATSRLSIGPIWQIGDQMLESPPYFVVIGILLGLVGAGLAYCFALFHAHVMTWFRQWSLLDNDHAVYRAVVGGLGFLTIGIVLPQTLFWSEAEIPMQATGAAASTFPHVWPTTGLVSFESDTALKSLLVGLAKLAAISFTVAGGLRGGFIFPLLFVGTAVGRAVALWTGWPLPVATLCTAAAVNVAITRAALGTSLVLCFLSGHLVTFPAILMASLTSLFATSYLKFLKTQICRADVDHSLFRRDYLHDYIDDNDAELSDEGES